MPSCSHADAPTAANDPCCDHDSGRHGKAGRGLHFHKDCSKIDLQKAELQRLHAPDRAVSAILAKAEITEAQLVQFLRLTGAPPDDPPPLSRPGRQLFLATLRIRQ